MVRGRASHEVVAGTQRDRTTFLHPLRMIENHCFVAGSEGGR